MNTSFLIEYSEENLKHTSNANAKSEYVRALVLMPWLSTHMYVYQSSLIVTSLYFKNVI